jgi:hypothetical protein
MAEALVMAPLVSALFVVSVLNLVFLLAFSVPRPFRKPRKRSIKSRRH